MGLHPGTLEGCFLAGWGEPSHSPKTVSAVGPKALILLWEVSSNLFMTSGFQDDEAVSAVCGIIFLNKCFEYSNHNVNKVSYF